MKNMLFAVLATMVFSVGAQGVADAAPNFNMGMNNPAYVMLDDEEEVTLVVDEPVESGDVLVDEDGDEWVVQ